MPQSILEESIETLFVDLLNENNILHIKGNSRGLKGWPDRIVFGDKIYFVELKVGRSGGSYYKQSKMQNYWQRQIEGSNGMYALLTGENEVRSFVDKIKKRVG